jgi:hypothetical protein
MQTNMKQGVGAQIGTGTAEQRSSPRSTAFFYGGLFALVLFEILNVYFIMPMPWSQRLRGVDFAYLLYTCRWPVRVACVLAIAWGLRGAFGRPRAWRRALVAVLASGAIWYMNFRMSADHMFRQPESLVFQPRARNQVDEAAVIVGVERNGEARAYPIRFLVYHHQVQDTLGGEPLLVTYCNVCRSARVFRPLVGGRKEEFRLVGMDQFNAMLEDKTTGSWWRQANGEAVTGPLKGTRLEDVEYRQVTLRNWFEMHPAALVMQMDEASAPNFDAEGKYERGLSKGHLTRTDPQSWNDKSWVLGVEIGATSKAYDWNRLKRERIINDEFGGKAIVIALAMDGSSYGAFERPALPKPFTIEGDVISAGNSSYGLDGRDRAGSANRLKAIRAHQEFWHSWRTFHPQTLVDR